MQINSSLLSAGLDAYQAGQQRVDRASVGIADLNLPVVERSQAVSDSVELTDELVQMRVGEHQAKAGARLLETADDVLGTLINTTA